METHFKFQKSESSYLNLASDIQGTRGGGGGSRWCQMFRSTCTAKCKGESGKPTFVSGPDVYILVLINILNFLYT